MIDPSGYIWVGILFCFLVCFLAFLLACWLACRLAGWIDGRRRFSAGDSFSMMVVVVVAPAMVEVISVAVRAMTSFRPPSINIV